MHGDAADLRPVRPLFRARELATRPCEGDVDTFGRFLRRIPVLPPMARSCDLGQRQRELGRKVSGEEAETDSLT